MHSRQLPLYKSSVIALIILNRVVLVTSPCIMKIVNVIVRKNTIPALQN